MKKKTNQNIWNSFWKNEKSGRLRSDPKELTLYDDELDGDSGVNRIFGARFGEMQSNEGWDLSQKKCNEVDQNSELRERESPRSNRSYIQACKNLKMAVK